MQKKLSFVKRFSLFYKECVSFYSFYKKNNRQFRDIVFYSEETQYISFFDGLMDALINNHDAKFCYVTSDYNDPILSSHSPNIRAFYIRTLFSLFLPFLSSKVIILTMPDLNQFHIKKSTKGTNHIYVFHSLVSTHMIYRLGAFNHYDTIFCAGPHHIQEVRQTEKLYNLNPKRLLEVGYNRVERIYSDHKNYIQKSNSEANAKTKAKANLKKCVLIAPSWGELNIIESCGKELIEPLLRSGYMVVLRPHPVTITKKPDQILSLDYEFGSHENFRLDTKTESEEFIHDADVLVCDWSGIALEYAFGTERPVLFIDIPRKIHNPEYEKLDIEPIEVLLRVQIGKIIKRDDVPKADKIISDFLTNREFYRDKIVSAREKYVYNFGKSSEIGAQFIMEICNSQNSQ
ncbi:CDP-glycerol glycerophosphotransferase family protein [Acidobacteriota bacterium]